MSHTDRDLFGFAAAMTRLNRLQGSKITSSGLCIGEGPHYTACLVSITCVTGLPTHNETVCHVLALETGGRGHPGSNKYNTPHLLMLILTSRDFKTAYIYIFPMADMACLHS